MIKFVVELENNLPVSEIGGKAYSLSVLVKNGFNVPPAFVITSSAFFDFLKHNRLLEQVQKLASEITQDNFKEKSTQAREAILKGEMPEGIVSEIKGFLNGLGAQYFSIRSSAVSEDSLKASFAGLFDTFLNVKVELPLVLEYVKRCWASLFNERAVAYRVRKGVPYLEGMAVIVQKMMPAEVSGITFTVHPSNKGALLVEASYGLGNTIVGGQVDPDDFTVDRKTLEILDKKIGNKALKAVCQNGEIQIVNVEKALIRKQSLANEKVKENATLCLKVEKIFNHPQDIEWCIFDEKLWLLQSRPITGIMP